MPAALKLSDSEQWVDGVVGARLKLHLTKSLYATTIGFIGAGAILRRGKRDEVVHGVTTAATVWVAAALGVACGLGDWPVAILALVLVFVILVIAKPIERRWLDHLQALEAKRHAAEPPPAAPDSPA